jgi:hypothetical protein
MIWAFIVNAALSALAITIHYQMFSFLTSSSDKLPIKPRGRILYIIYGLLIAHVLEIWLFAAAFYFMGSNQNFGHLSGEFDGSFADSVYFSFAVYTTLGFGDIIPEGYFRFLAGLEAITGLLMISWSASFVYVEMQKYWRKKH